MGDDVISGRGKVVDAPGKHVGNVLRSVPLTIAPGPRSEGSMAQSHDVLMFLVTVPWIRGERKQVRGGESWCMTRTLSSLAEGMLIIISMQLRSS